MDRESVSSHDEDEKNRNDKNSKSDKNGKNDNVQKKGLNELKDNDIDTDSIIPWAANEKNPDYNLVVINAANKDFVSKMSIETGSYMITEFVSKMVENHRNGGIWRNKDFLGEIMTKIQTKLHRKGIQLPEAKYNNGTDKIVFIKNK